MIVYVYDGWNPIAEYSGTTLSKTYTWGMDVSGSLQGAGGVGGLLVVTDSTGSYFPTYDGNGNVSEYLDATGAIAAHYEYDPFGRDTISNGIKPTGFTHRFSTKPVDSATSMLYYGYRYYDPLTGRWPSRDPIEEEGGINLYGFVTNDGANKWDMFGLCGYYFPPGTNPCGGGDPPSTDGNYSPSPNTSDGLSYLEGATHFFKGPLKPNNQAERVDLDVPFSVMDKGWQFSDFIQYPCKAGQGYHQLEATKVVDFYSAENFFTIAGPGRVVVRLTGILDVYYGDGSGTWKFEGVVSIDANRFDFDPKKSTKDRGFWKEHITRTVSDLQNIGGGKEFTVTFSGNRSMSACGECIGY